MPYIYLIQCTQHINLRENIYKFGKTNDFKKRFSAYPKGSVPIYILYVNDDTKCEKDILYTLSQKFIKRHDAGNEYFEGNPASIIKTINEYVNNNIDKHCYRPNNNIVNRKVVNENDDIYLQFLNEKIQIENQCSERMHCSKLYIIFKTWFNAKIISATFVMQSMPNNREFIGGLRNYIKIKKVCIKGLTQLGILNIKIK